MRKMGSTLGHGFIAVGVAILTLGTTASAETIYKVYSDGWVVPINLSAIAKQTPIPVSKNLTANGITFNIAYEDVETSTGEGFDDPALGAERRAAVERALTTVANTLNETGVLDVEIAASTNLGGNTLAIGGTFFSSAVGFSNGIAFLRIQSGAKPFSEVPEIFAQVDFSNNFYAGADPQGIAPGQTDLETVMLHEFTHGIGLLSLSDPQGISAILDNNSDPLPGVFSVWDSLMLRGAGATNLFVGPSPVLGQTFQGVPADLVSGDLFFSGQESTAAFGSNPPLYAPSTFASGSSLSHWDTGNVPVGAVMEHVIFQGEISREYPDFEKAPCSTWGGPTSISTATTRTRHPRRSPRHSLRRRRAPRWRATRLCSA